jgi:hypothetical protein
MSSTKPLKSFIIQDKPTTLAPSKQLLKENAMNSSRRQTRFKKIVTEITQQTELAI